ncbi:hypothetical protein SEVIR_8G060901v4 [Setaria viridis]
MNRRQVCEEPARLLRSRDVGSGRCCTGSESVCVKTHRILSHRNPRMTNGSRSSRRAMANQPDGAAAAAAYPPWVLLERFCTPVVRGSSIVDTKTLAAGYTTTNHPIARRRALRRAATGGVARVRPAPRRRPAIRFRSPCGPR